MFTFKIYTLGCKVNQYDSQSLKNKLISLGFKFAKKNEQADLAIVNTCSVTKNAHRKDRLMIKRVKKENPQAKIVVMGCWYKVYPEIKEELKADLFWPVGKLDQLTKKIQTILPRYQGKVLHRDKALLSSIKSPGRGERSRYFMKVQDGCQQFCSYCAIPYSRGKLQSRDWEEIIYEAQQAEEVGYREIILCGIHLGLYNQEKNNHQSDKNLAWLISKILQRTEKLRVRISSIEVNDINEELIELLKKEKRFCKHLHIPLQGGEDGLLKQMNRPYDTKYFRKKIQKVRKVASQIAITTDVIVGFPGETEKQFQSTVEFIKKMEFSKLHVFPYSKHERTLAAKMPDHLDKSVKNKRSKVLRDLSEDLWKQYQENILNQKQQFEIIVEEINQDFIIGKTEYYFNLKILRRNNDLLPSLRIGEIINVVNDKLILR